jgi:hypothetical protein
MTLFGLRLEFHEFRPARTGRSGTQEPRLDDVTKLGRGTLPREDLNRVVPSHAAEGRAASDEDYLGLILGRCSHCLLFFGVFEFARGGKCGWDDSHWRFDEMI